MSMRNPNPNPHPNPNLTLTRFDIAELRRRADAAGAAAQPRQGRVELEVGGLAPGLAPGGAPVSTTMLSCLETLMSGRGMRCTARPAFQGTQGQDMVELG